MIIKKIYEENEYLKCQFRNMTGILKKADLAYTLPQGLPSTMQSVANPTITASSLKKKDEVERILASVKPFSQ